LFSNFSDQLFSETQIDHGLQPKLDESRFVTLWGASPYAESVLRISYQRRRAGDGRLQIAPGALDGAIRLRPSATAEPTPTIIRIFMMRLSDADFA
jgi:hypothetical protein